MNLHDPDTGKAKELSRDRQLGKACERAIEHPFANTETMFAATFTIVFHWFGHGIAIQVSSAQLDAPVMNVLLPSTFLCPTDTAGRSRAS